MSDGGARAPGVSHAPAVHGAAAGALPAPAAEAARAAEPATAAAGPFPMEPLEHLDALWIQVAGTLCNLRCTHCFVSCGPGDDHHALLSREEVRGRVAEAVRLGVKEFYFTGGEPFLHPAMLEILGDTLVYGPCTVLTNGTLFTRGRLEALRRMSDSERYSLEIRVSLDGHRAEDHDRYRGAGSFALALDGLRRLGAHGLLPIVTVTQNTDEDPLAFRERYLAMLRAAGLARPRLKVIPLFLLGRETERTRGYSAAESLRDLPAEAFDPARLQCHSCRAVTSRGVFVCPLLVDEPRARMGERLDQALGPFELAHGACFTCYATGMTCGNA
ncbi:MAG TPA: radical SAM protein [Candidatus Eisenbacteria bacterium]|jgi:molybdenum cofactor biosynthesis enzyme MoaA